MDVGTSEEDCRNHLKHVGAPSGEGVPVLLTQQGSSKVQLGDKEEAGQGPRRGNPTSRKSKGFNTDTSLYFPGHAET